MRKLLYFFILLLITTISSCDQTPDEVLPASKMEDILFDYHVAQAILEQMPEEESKQVAEEYLSAIFKKHAVTEAEFDSSMIWYNRHVKKLNKIYANVTEKLQEENEKLQLATGNTDMVSGITAGTDTVNIWTGRNLFILRNTDLHKHTSFTIKADTSFHRNEKYTLQTNITFFKENRDDRMAYMDMGLTIEYKNGKTIGANRRINYTGEQQIQLQTDAENDIKSIKGYFYYSGNDNQRNFICVNNISLVRMYKSEADTIAQKIITDSIPADSSVQDTAPAPEKPRLSPKEIQEQLPNTDRIRIKARPDIRTPNSFGTRRKTKPGRITK